MKRIGPIRKFSRSGKNFPENVLRARDKKKGHTHTNAAGGKEREPGDLGGGGKRKSRPGWLFSPKKTGGKTRDGDREHLSGHNI